MTEGTRFILFRVIDKTIAGLPQTIGTKRLEFVDEVASATEIIQEIRDDPTCHYRLFHGIITDIDPKKIKEL